MDKNKKMKEIKELVEKKQYSLALEMLESMDVQTELTEKDLSVFAEVYICNKQFAKAKALLEVMFKNNATKKSISQLIFVSLIMDNIIDAETYYKEYIKIAPNDVNVLVFRYRIDKAKGASPSVLINTLEKLEDKSYNDEFAYALAEAYATVGDDEKCIKKCNEIIVLSQNKSFENMAKRLKSKTMSAMNIKKDDVLALKSDSINEEWKEFREKNDEYKLEDRKESIAISDLLKEQENNKRQFNVKTDSIAKDSSIDNIEAKARLNIELSAKKALEDRFKAIENKKKEVEYKLKQEQSIRSELEKKIKNYEVIKQSLEDKIRIQDKNKDYIEDLLKKAELSKKETEQKLNAIYEQKLNIENKFNKLDEISKSQSEKLIKEVANNRKIEERLSEREMKVNQLIERLQLEEKTKSQLLNNLETKEKYSEGLESRLENCERVKSDLEEKYNKNIENLQNAEKKLAEYENQIDTLNMQIKNTMVEKNQLEVSLRQYEQNRRMLQQNLSDHVKNKQMLENRCKQILEHKRHIEQRLRDTEIIRDELDSKVKEYEQKEIVLEDSIRAIREEYSDYKNKKENEITLEQERYEVDMKRSKESFQREIENLKEKNRNEISELKEKNSTEIAELKEKNSKELEEVRQKLTIEKDNQLQNIFTEKERELEKIRQDAQNTENDLKIEKEQLKRRLEKDMSDVKCELEERLKNVQDDLERKLSSLQNAYDDQKDHLNQVLNENKMLGNNVEDKIGIINSLDARLKEVMAERKRLVAKNKELDHRLGIEISNNKKLDDMVTKHIEGKTHMETVIAQNQDKIKRLDSKNEQGKELIRKLEERVKYETEAKLDLEQRLHQSEVKATNLEKELRDIKTQLREQRDKEISLVEKSGEELLSSSMVVSTDDKGIELDDIGFSSDNGIEPTGGIYDTLTTSVSQFLDEIVDDIDDVDNNDEYHEGSDIVGMFDDTREEDIDSIEEDYTEDIDEVQEEDTVDDGLPMIDMKAIEAELNIAPITSHLEEVRDVNAPAPRLRNKENSSDNIGSFFDSPNVPDYKKQSYADEDRSVVSQLFGTSEEQDKFEPDKDEKNQFYHEIMQSQMFDPFENKEFVSGMADDYKNEPINIDLFSYYYYSPYIMDMIQKAVFGMKNNRKNNHIVISAPDYYNKSELSKMVAKQLAEKQIIATNKIARISGEAFNKVDLDVKAPKLLDGTVIIQNAENINSGAFDKLVRLINNYEGRIVVILETNVPSAMIFANKPSVSTYFKGTINIPKYSVNFVLEYVRTVLAVRGMGISREAENDLANMFNNKIKNNMIFTLEELLTYVETFIDSAMKRKKGKGKHPTDIIIRQDININW
ncbi:MAG: hypothetical protein E7262_08095 [Lachnospiraceae bacterium]|nr:hypothetical protein [Lachnospiraceae bacterium]